MKINFERKQIRFFLQTFLLVLATFITGCDSEEIDNTPEKLIGTWNQVSQTIDGTQVSKDSTRLLIQIDEHNICVLCDSSKVAVASKKIVKRSGWSYTSGLFNLAIDIPVSWKPIVDNEKLTLEKIEFNQTGSIKKTIQVYKKVADIKID